MTDSELKECKHDLIRGVWQSDGDHHVECARCGERMPCLVASTAEPLFTSGNGIITFSACRQHVQRYALYTGDDSITCALMKFDNDKAMKEWEKENPTFSRVWWR